MGNVKKKNLVVWDVVDSTNKNTVISKEFDTRELARKEVKRLSEWLGVKAKVRRTEYAIVDQKLVR